VNINFVAYYGNTIFFKKKMDDGNKKMSPI